MGRGANKTFGVLASTAAPGQDAHSPHNVDRYLLGSAGIWWYFQRVTMFQLDRISAGTPSASSADLSWQETVKGYALPQVSVEQISFSQPSCFRSFEPRLSTRSIPKGERPGRKQGPEHNSHKSLSIAVAAARNVVRHS